MARLMAPIAHFGSLQGGRRTTEETVALSNTPTANRSVLASATPCWQLLHKYVLETRLL
jgi:hypothetical protein